MNTHIDTRFVCIVFVPCQEEAVTSIRNKTISSGRHELSICDYTVYSDYN
uniref:Bm13250 n=1 Tax=Brugia malayi TaxID=6279 RepID=A0A0J9XPE8_BRUMA|nr:Bm13250 [Brugia malayi]